MLKEKIYSVLMKTSFLDEPPMDEATLKNDLGIDSLRLVELIVELEEACNVTINESDLDPQKLQTVRDICNLIQAYAGELRHAV